MIGATRTELTAPPRPAALGDVQGMAGLINGYAEQGLMLPKSPSELYRHLREYLVLTGPEGEVVGCGGLRIYRPELAEIVGLAVARGWQGLGFGSALVDRLGEIADGLGIPSVFAMTLDEGFFRRMGFHTVPRNALPDKLHGDCRGCSRKPGCSEIAMLKALRDEGGSARPRGRGRRLRVLSL